MIKSNNNIQLRVPKSSVWNVGNCLLPTNKINLTQISEVTLSELIGEHQLSFYRQRINDEYENMTSPSALLAMTSVIVDWFWLPTTTVSDIHILIFLFYSICVYSNNNSNKSNIYLCWSWLFQIIKVSVVDKPDRLLYIRSLSLHVYDDKPLLSLTYHGQLITEAETPGELPWKCTSEAGTPGELPWKCTSEAGTPGELGWESTSHVEEVTLQGEVSLLTKSQTISLWLF